MSLKQAAEDLLKVADEIEKEAEEVTQFVCEECNHTASLAKINAARDEAGKEAGENVTVSRISVNDSIICPACGGKMAYQETEDSSKFYFDPEQKSAGDEEEEKEEKEEKEEEKAVSEPIDYDSLKRYSSAE